VSTQPQATATILLVEDTLELAGLIQREFAGAGYRVQIAATGAQALALFAAGPPDLVILDWMLPDIDGMAVLHAIRRTSLLPVLMLTARGDPIDRVVGLETGADDYLVKPFNMMELLARVRALLRRVEHIRQTLAADAAGMAGAGMAGAAHLAAKPGAHAPALCAGPLRLEPDTRLAWLDGQPLELTRLEFDLLHLLLRNPGRPFNRLYLLETVWGQAYLESDRSVDNTVLRLRRKLGAFGERIETVRSVGYRLRVEGRPGE